MLLSLALTRLRFDALTKTYRGCNIILLANTTCTVTVSAQLFQRAEVFLPLLSRAIPRAVRAALHLKHGITCRLPRSICALFVGLTLLSVVLGVIR